MRSGHGDTVVADPRAPDHPTAPTVLASWTATVVRALEARGVDGIDLVRRAGIDPDQLEVDGARIPLDCSTALWQLAVEATGDACIGLDVARHARPGTFHGLSVAVVSSGRFREALQRIVRYAEVVCSPSGRAELVEHEDRVEYSCTWAPGSVQPSHESMEAILACIVRAGRFLMGRNLSPCSVELIRPERPAVSRFETFFGCPVLYGMDRYLLTYPIEAMDRPLPTGCDEVARHADEVAGSYLERVSPSEHVTDRARHAIATLIGEDGVSSSAVASRLAMSARTMQRRLREEGTSFRDLVADVRVAMAKRAIVGGVGSVQAVADRVGFSDAAAFRRAFKRATGMTPAEYASDQAGRPSTDAG